MVKDKKVLPHLSSYANDPERIEEQANRMAKEGWILEKFGSLFSTYRRGKAGEYEYRVQVKEAGIDRLTYIAELTEFGIEEVGGVGDLLVLRKKADGTPFDLYSDLDSLIACTPQMCSPDEEPACRTLWQDHLLSLLPPGTRLVSKGTSIYPSGFQTIRNCRRTEIREIQRRIQLQRLKHPDSSALTKFIFEKHLSCYHAEGDILLIINRLKRERYP